MTSQASQALGPDVRPDLDAASELELSQVAAPLSERDRKRLADFYARLIAEADAELPLVREIRPGAARWARRVTRQRADRLVRVLSPARRAAVGVSTGSGVAA